MRAALIGIPAAVAAAGTVLLAVLPVVERLAEVLR